jgi:hypothetical protein
MTIETFNIYCDESCHLEHDQHNIMVLGAVWCHASASDAIAQRLREIRMSHGLSPGSEMKWVKVSPASVSFYGDVVDYFFSEENLHFRALVAHHKDRLSHGSYHQDHDTWYYKMYFRLLNVLLDPTARYRIYLDVKDTRSEAKTRKLGEVLCNSMYDFEREIIERIQTVKSHEVEQVQLADVLTGAVGYANRGLATSSAKLAIVDRIRRASGYSLLGTTLLRENKVNLFHWEPRRIQE